MVSLFGRGFDSLQLHFVTPSCGLHKKKEGFLIGEAFSYVNNSGALQYNPSENATLPHCHFATLSTFHCEGSKKC